ncbi:MAG TPA: 4-hydroxy-tetrahydrodipicolinate reductase [Bacillota bacterium]|nr:4-hydroxy-tetrahydrodipicolinate reductase [Bacillota bacterium]
MIEQIRVAIAGSKGRMGQEAVKMVLGDPNLKLVVEIGRTPGQGTATDVPYLTSIEQALNEYQPHVLVDLTTPHVVKENMQIAIAQGVRPVVGTTGFTPEEIAKLDHDCRQKGLGAIIAPNFAIGALLMMKFAKEAAKYMPHVEIIELHHDKKLDAPSGTAIKTAELIAEVREEFRQGHPEEKEVIEGARGGYYNGFRIHSVRLPGMVAHQEVLFSHTGQTLSIRHDSLNRESFMPGINLAIKKVMELDYLVYGLENLLD